MNKLIGVSIVAALSLLSFGAYAGNSNIQKCSESTLRGTYVFNSHGKTNGNDYADVGHEYFDGRGHVIGESLDNSGNKAELIGTYDIHHDCTGTIDYSSTGAHEKIYLSSKGDTFVYIESSENSYVSGVETRQ